MKKITVLAVALLAISFASCKKDRVCKCTDTDSNGDVTVYEATLVKSSKGDAKDACSNSSHTETSGGQTGTSKTDCELK